MADIKNIAKQPLLRKTEIIRLQSYLVNPGRFSILVLGERGTGKTHWVEQLQIENKKDKHLKQIVSIPCGVSKSDLSYWENILKVTDGKLVLFEEVDKLSKVSQDILFEWLSTKDGKYGFGKKTIECRVAFTSSKHISVLRDNEEFLLHKFYDRISQFVVELPAFQRTQRNIVDDLKATWLKMEFTGKVPGDELNTWLIANTEKLHGNFRDLDKIVINWNNWRLLKKNENEILSLVTNEFNLYYHNPVPSIGLHDTFVFKREKAYDQLLDDFRSNLKDWAKIEYGDLKQAAKGLKVSKRTMERW